MSYDDVLYLHDGYLKEWDATVMSVDNKYVVLDKTAFYPNAGGQPNDTGVIVSGAGEFRVVFAAKIVDRISCEVDHDGLHPDDKVHCRIDWARRYPLMRMHTAAHVLSRVIYDETGAFTSGNQLGIDQSRIDFTLENFDREKIGGWFTKANRLISENHKITLRFLPREEALSQAHVIRTNVMLIPESVKVIRLVDIEGVDCQACGGTHLGTTGEIKGIEFVKTENKGKDNRRIYFKLRE